MKVIQGRLYLTGKIGNAFITHACAKTGRVQFRSQKNGQGAFWAGEKRAGLLKVANGNTNMNNNVTPLENLNLKEKKI